VLSSDHIAPPKRAPSVPIAPGRNSRRLEDGRDQVRRRRLAVGSGDSHHAQRPGRIAEVRGSQTRERAPRIGDDDGGGARDRIVRARVRIVDDDRAGPGAHRCFEKRVSVRPFAPHGDEDRIWARTRRESSAMPRGFAPAERDSPSTRAPSSAATSGATWTVRAAESVIGGASTCWRGEPSAVPPAEPRRAASRSSRSARTPGPRRRCRRSAPRGLVILTRIT
jgi:hypothetical protein